MARWFQRPGRDVESRFSLKAVNPGLSVKSTVRSVRERVLLYQID